MSRSKRASARQRIPSFAGRAPGCASSGTSLVEQASWANERVWKLPVGWRSEGPRPTVAPIGNGHNGQNR